MFYENWVGSWKQKKQTLKLKFARFTSSELDKTELLRLSHDLERNF